MNKMIFLLFMMMSLTFSSCSNDNGSGDEELNNSKPSNLSITVNVIGTDSENPNGDGSGKVDFKISATNATSYRVLINYETLELTQNMFSYTFVDEGTHYYNVIFSAYNQGQFISKTITV